MGKRKVLVTGSGGQLGGAICAEFSAEALVPLTHAELDLVDHGNLLKVVTAHNPSIIINCAGYNRVDEAENNAEMALAVNAFGVRSLARAATDVGAIFVHYSTDFVFDGVATVPYTEQDEASPRNVYGTSKLIGEWFASDIMGAYILRVESLFGGTPARSSIDQITDAVANGREPNVFMDRVVSPSFVHDVARATRSLIDAQAPAGLYHCVNTGHTTWLHLAEEIKRQLRSTTSLRPISVASLSLPAVRPVFCALSNAKLAAAGFEMPSWQDALTRHLASRRQALR